MSKFHRMNSGWDAKRARQLRAEPLCRHCAAAVPPRVTLAGEVDHIVPLSRGGSDAPENLQSLCRECHALKTRRDMGRDVPAEFGTDGLPNSPDHPWAAARRKNTLT